MVASVDWLQSSLLPNKFPLDFIIPVKLRNGILSILSAPMVYFYYQNNIL